MTAAQVTAKLQPDKEEVCMHTVDKRAGSLTGLTE